MSKSFMSGIRIAVGCGAFLSLGSCRSIGDPTQIAVMRVSVFAPNGTKALTLRIGETLRLSAHTVSIEGDSSRGVLIAHSWAVRTPGVVTLVSDDFVSGVGVGVTRVVLLSAINNDSLTVTVR